MLQYDNNAFNFFALSILSIYLLPSWNMILRRVWRALFVNDDEIGAQVRTSVETKKASELKRSQKGLATLRTSNFITHLAVTVVLSMVFGLLLWSVSQDGEVNSFDPFSILGIDSGADTKEIRQARKRLALLYHPDKNPNNPKAEAMFAMVEKAYEALTDPVAKENWIKYGNPDGKQSLEVSIGLPSFLLEIGNRNLVLFSYLLFMVVIIPLCVWNYYRSSSKYGEKDVMYESYSWYHHNLSEHFLIKGLPETFAGSAEFREKNRPRNNTEKEAIAKLMGKVRSQMQKPKYNHPLVIKGNVLMHCHLLRQTVDNEELADDLKDMLRYSMALVDAMITVCQHQDWLNTAINCIEFGQCITQACWTKDNSLMQIPHFTEEEIKHCAKGKAANRATNLGQYLALPDDMKKGLASMTDEHRADVLRCCALFPNITVETGIYVDDDEDDKIYEGDLLTIEVCITRNNLAAGETAGLVHAPRFPFPKQEAWWVLLATPRDQRVLSVEKVKDPAKVVKHKIKFLAPKQGEYEFDLYVKSNAYLGLDQKHKIRFTALDPSTLPEYKVHPEDAEIEDEPTLFEEMLNQGIEEDSDDDESDSDDDDNDNANNTKKTKEGNNKLNDAKTNEDSKKGTATAAEKKKAALRNARKKAADLDDDDGDDSSVEEVYSEK